MVHLCANRGIPVKLLNNSIYTTLDRISLKVVILPDLIYGTMAIIVYLHSPLVRNPTMTRNPMTYFRDDNIGSPAADRLHLHLCFLFFPASTSAPQSPPLPHPNTIMSHPVHTRANKTMLTCGRLNRGNRQRIEKIWWGQHTRRTLIRVFVTLYIAHSGK